MNDSDDPRVQRTVVAVDFLLLLFRFVSAVLPGFIISLTFQILTRCGDITAMVDWA